MYFEDVAQGQVIRSARRTLTEAEIIAFARQWDPQAFHLDAEAGRASHFGGLVASGFHTLLTAFNLSLETNTWREGSMGSPGMEEVRWLLPVRPSDTLEVEILIADARASRSRPDRGIVVFDHTVRNQREETVMTFRSTVFLSRRPA